MLEFIIEQQAKEMMQEFNINYDDSDSDSYVSLGLGVNRHSYTHQCNSSSTQHPDTIFEIFYPHFSLPMPRGFYLIINKGIWLLALAERPRVFPIR